MPLLFFVLPILLLPSSPFLSIEKKKIPALQYTLVCMDRVLLAGIKREISLGVVGGENFGMPQFPFLFSFIVRTVPFQKGYRNISALLRVISPA